MKIYLPIYLYIFAYLLNIINSEPIWKITFYDNEDLEQKNPNNLTIIKGNYKTIKIIIEENKNNITDITHINTTLKLNNTELNIIPNEIVINTNQSLQYYFELGISCNTDLDSTTLLFDIEDNNIKDLIEIEECHIDIVFIQKKIFVEILNADNIVNNLFSKLYVKQEFKNFDDIVISFTDTCMKYLESMDNIILNAYNYSNDRLIYYSLIKPDINRLKDKEKEDLNCKINPRINNKNQCFILDDSKIIEIFYNNKTIQLGTKETFYHNSIASSYIDKNKDDELTLFFYKEVFYFVSYCSIQDINTNLLSNHEILNQRLDNNNNIFATFNISQFNNKISEPKIIFKNLRKDINYKIKCIFDFFDNDKIELTYGEGMQIPIKINFNETKNILGSNCYNDEYMKKKLDTRYCDTIDHRLVFDISYDMNYKYKLNNFNYTDFANYSNKNKEEKIEHIKDIIKNNEISSSEIDLISTLSDYLYLIDCQGDSNCQNEKGIIFNNILNKYDKIEIGKIHIDKDEQLVLNDILLFNNIIQNTDVLNYEYFEFIVNNILDRRNAFFSSSIKQYNYYLTNYFLLIFDKFISIIIKYKSIYDNKFPFDEKLNIDKSDILIKFYDLFIGWISQGMLTREEKLNKFCKNIYVNYVELPVSSNIKTIINSTISIEGFDSEESKILYKNIYYAGAILYNNFPLFPLNNKKSEAVTLFLYTDTRNNFVKEDIAYREAFKIIFKKKKIDNYCYLWNNDYLNDGNEIVNNYIATEYLNKDDDSNYDINCISRIMISPMTVILGQNDIKGNIFKEGINFFSIMIIILLTLCLIIISLPFLLSKYYKKKAEKADLSINELN